MKKLASRKDTRVIDLLIAFGPEGYGIYALLREYLAGRKALRSVSDLKRIAYELHADPETVRAVLEDFGLFDCTGSEYYNLGQTPAPVREETVWEGKLQPCDQESKNEENEPTPLTRYERRRRMKHQQRTRTGETRGHTRSR